jgi:hypothetical protein
MLAMFQCRGLQGSLVRIEIHGVCLTPSALQFSPSRIAGSLLSILAVNDVYETVRPLLVREGVIPEDAEIVRPDNLKALGSLWRTHCGTIAPTHIQCGPFVQLASTNFTSRQERAIFGANTTHH